MKRLVIFNKKYESFSEALRANDFVESIGDDLEPLYVDDSESRMMHLFAIDNTINATFRATGVCIDDFIYGVVTGNRFIELSDLILHFEKETGWPQQIGPISLHLDINEMEYVYIDRVRIPIDVFMDGPYFPLEREREIDRLISEIGASDSDVTLLKQRLKTLMEWNDTYILFYSDPTQVADKYLSPTVHTLEFNEVCRQIISVSAKLSA